MGVSRAEEAARMRETVFAVAAKRVQYGQMGT